MSKLTKQFKEDLKSTLIDAALGGLGNILKEVSDILIKGEKIRYEITTGSYELPLEAKEQKIGNTDVRIPYHQAIKGE